MSAHTAHLDTFARDSLPPREQWPELIFNLPELRYAERLNCASELLDNMVEGGFAERPCLLAPGTRWTYAELLERANRIAHVLVEDLGIVPGNRVLLRAPNMPMLVACWYAVMKAGAIAVTTMPLLRAGELAVILEAARIRHALCDAQLLEELEKARGQAPVLERVLPFQSDAAQGLGARMASKPTAFANVATAAEDVCLIAFTSGTTGRPKGCMHDHRDVLAICDSFSRHVLRPGPEDVFCGSPPIAFTYGLGGLVTFPMRVGAAALLLEKAPPEALLQSIGDFGATICFTAPVAYKAMLALLDEHDIGTLRKCVSAGEHLPKATFEAFEAKTGIRIIDGIGATEMLHIFISAAGDDIRAGATGKAVPGYEARVVGEDGRPLPPGETGMLAVRGPTGCRYLADERQTDYVKGGWNYTGDAYRMDEDSYFWYQARADDMIIAAGYNIAGPEVENALLRHAAVRECAVIGALDAERGTIVKAFVVLAEGETGDEAMVQALQEHVKQVIAPYKCPRAIAFVDALPRTETGKLQRFRLRERERKRAGGDGA